MRSFHLCLRLGTAFALGVGLAGNAAFAQTLPLSAARPPATNVRDGAPAFAPRMPNLARAKVTAATATYALKDVGAPPSTYRLFYAPFGFNKTGQIVGEAYLAASPGSSYQQCIAWTGQAWVNVGTAPTLNCYATSGISDANSSGVFATVGELNVPTQNQLVAYHAVVSPKSSSLTPFPSNAPSELYAMNASGLAAGNSYYEPVGGFDYYYAAVTSSGSSLAIVQPSCTTAKAGCIYDPYMYIGTSSETRSLNAGGTILGNATNATNGAWVEYTGGSKPTYVQFSIPTDSGYGAGDVRGIDDKGNVVYNEYDPGTKKTLGWVYSPSTKKARSFGTISGSSCTQYVPIYINGPGRVLGYTIGCSFASDQTYFTWDATNGLVPLTFNHSAYYTATPVLINDLGQLAIDLTTTAGVHHWGILTPPTKL